MSAIGVNPAAGGGGLRPLGVGETLDRAISVYRNNATTLWKTVAVVIVPIYILQLIVREATLPSGVFVHNGQLYVNSSTGASTTGGTVALLLVAFLGLLANLLATGAVFKLFLDAELDRPRDWRESLQFARGKVGSLLWLALLTTVLAMIGFLLFVLPFIWFIVASSVAVPVLMLEGVKGFHAIRRSMHLVRKRWWATFLRLLAALLLYFLIVFVFGLIVAAITRGLSVGNVTLLLVISAVLNALVAILITPFVAGVITTVYLDLRVRKEAYDIELLASHSAQAGGGGAAPAGGTPSGGVGPSPSPAGGGLGQGGPGVAGGGAGTPAPSPDPEAPHSVPPPSSPPPMPPESAGPSPG